MDQLEKGVQDESKKKNGSHHDRMSTHYRVYIYVSDMTGKYTSSVGLYKNGKGEGTNYSDSTNRLYVILYSADPGKGWGKRDQRLLNPGSSSGQFSASNSVAASWRVELNPYGVGTSGCRGFGKVTAN